MSPIGGTCVRARAWSSRELDGDLSELEGAMLRRHLQRCEPCATFVENSAHVTRSLRKAPLEGVSFPIVVTRRRHRARVLRPALGVAAACVVCATAGITVSRELRYQDPPVPPGSPMQQRLFASLPKPGPGVVLPLGQRNARDDF